MTGKDKPPLAPRWRSDVSDHELAGRRAPQRASRRPKAFFKSARGAPSFVPTMMKGLPAPQGVRESTDCGAAPR